MHALELAAPDVVAEKFQEGIIILNLKTGNYFDLGERSVPLLDALAQGINIDALKKALEAYEQGAGTQLSQVLSQLMEFGLVREVTALTNHVDPAICSAILAAGDRYHIECHSDLAEMIEADPIHDLDPKSGKLKVG